MEITKNYLHNISVGNFFQFKVYKVIDARKEIYFIGEPMSIGVVRIADTEEKLKQILEKDVPRLIKWLERTR